jgi:hypothetical protein
MRSALDELLFRNSPTKLAIRALWTAGFIAFPFAVTGKVPIYDEVILRIMAVFFSAFLVGIVMRLLASGPPMRFSRDGFEARYHGIPFVPWTDVEAAWTVRGRYLRFLCLKLRNPESVLQRLSTFRRCNAKLNRKFGYGDICLVVVDLTPGFTETLEYARKYIPRIKED